MSPLAPALRTVIRLFTGQSRRPQRGQPAEEWLEPVDALTVDFGSRTPTIGLKPTARRSTIQTAPARREEAKTLVGDAPADEGHKIELSMRTPRPPDSEHNR